MEVAIIAKKTKQKRSVTRLSRVSGHQEKNNGKLLEGYKGARENAYETLRSNYNVHTNMDKKAENVLALASVKAQQAAHHTENKHNDFPESEVPAIAQNGNTVAALTRQETIETHNKLVNEMDGQMWKPVKMGTRLDDATTKPKSQFPDL